MKKILVVDDEKPISDIVKFNLEKEGFEVVTAYDGEEAVEKVEEENPDLIVLDLMLPKMDGLESEQAKLDAKQAKLSQTIEEIERDLARSEAEKQDDTVVDPAAASHAMYADDKTGDVKDTPLEPEQDQAIPKDKVDEALHDNYLSDDEDFQLDKDNLADEEDASHKTNPNN